MSASRVVLVVFLVIAAVVAALWLVRRRPPLPPHLRPYFKNRAEMEAFLEEQRAADAKRRAELTDPADAHEAAEYLSLYGYDVVSPTFEKALHMVEASLKDNACDYGQLLGDIYAFSAAYRDPEKAYYHFYIGFSQDGCSVGFRDRNHDPPHYCGPVGDFRNESRVSELVTELGWDKVKQIDLKARAWLTHNGFEVRDFLDESPRPGELGPR